PLLAGESGERTGAPGVLPAGAASRIGGAAPVESGYRARTGPAPGGGAGMARGAGAHAGECGVGAGAGGLAVHGGRLPGGAGSGQETSEVATGLRRDQFHGGDSLLRLEQTEQAIPFLRAALAADPGMLAADASLGLALTRLGKNA